MPVDVKRLRRLLALVAALAAFSAGVAVPGHAVSRDGGDGYAGVSGEADRSPAGAKASRASVGITTPGIDVSHWQDAIDWTKVAEAGKRFAFMKATDGADYVDPTYVANRAAARANGLMVGAYHFSRPDASKGDARAEARFFVRVADPKPGDLLPVLDIETSRGLNQAGVTKWITTWVAEVRRLTGVIPMVYTSPYGWQTRTGDTRVVAREGAPLWVAHWGVSSPTLPAGDWDGHGWIVWQHTSSGKVPGIVGRVDLDRLAGTALGRIIVRRLSITVGGDAGRVTSRPTGLGCATTCEHNVDPDATVTLTAVPDAGAYFVRWTGDCSGTATTCTVRMGGARTAGARFVTDITPPTATLSGPRGFNGPVLITLDEDVHRVTPSNVVLRTQSGARVTAHRTCRTGAGATVPCTGTSVRSVALTPASPFVPGRGYRVTLDPAGAAPVRDRVGNPAATAVFAFRGASGVQQDHAPVIKKPAGAWKTVDSKEASGGTFVVSGLAGASASMAFFGTGVDWSMVTGPNRGLARMYVDGVLTRTIDLYAPIRTFGVARRIEGLTSGTHALRIVVLGRHRNGSAGSFVAIDRFDVLP